MSFESQLKAHVARIDARLDHLIPAVTVRPSRLHEAMRYSCLGPGKRIRPILCIESAIAVGADGATVMDAACAVEMVHAFSLIHDDLPAIDNDDLRRGRPTCHVQFGEAVAIMAGDSLFGLAFEVLAKSCRDTKTVAILAEASGSRGLAGGEMEDIFAEGQPVDADTLEFIHRNKTGALIRAACEIGAREGGGDEPSVGALRAYGEHIGLAFQIADDILNETSSAENLGKAVGSDRERMKATYPSVYGLEESSRRARAEVEMAKGRLDEANIASPWLHALADYSIQRLR